MPVKFRCRSCLREHVGLPVFGPEEPEAYVELTPDEREAAAISPRSVRETRGRVVADHPLGVEQREGIRLTHAISRVETLLYPRDAVRSP